MSIFLPPDGGSIGIGQSTAEAQHLWLTPDAHSGVKAWFYFVVEQTAPAACDLVIDNAHEVAFKGAFDGYAALTWDVREGEDPEVGLERALASEGLRRAVTRLDGGRMIIRHEARSARTAYAYFAPCGQAAITSWLEAVGTAPGASRLSLGTSVEGRTIEGLRIGEPGAASKTIWIVARQHAGETMATYWCQGFVRAALEDIATRVADATAGVVAYVVPNINPDGSARGHQRMNARGVDLNRRWSDPGPDGAELVAVRAKMVETGVDYLIDVHGEETMSYAFAMPASRVPSHDARRGAIYERFAASLLARNPDFQTEHGYPQPAPGKANLSLCSTWAAETFGAAAWTLEQPFKDAKNNPRPPLGWTPLRSRALGGDCYRALVETMRLDE